ncbi:MAG TPA: hypothetical protein VFR94_24880 [Nitrososphaeraceae archaeon]|nr:hypothetical protein [Nitrososphaeraceae archaeon]
MFDSVINVVLAHKQLGIAIAAFAVVAGSFSYIPYAAAQSLSVPGVDIDLSDGVMVDVTNGRYVHIDVSDGNVVVDVNGIHIDTGSFGGGFLP